MRSIDYPAVRKLVSVFKVLELIGYRPHVKEREQWRGPCPVCKKRTSDNRNFAATSYGWQCFACWESGNALDLYKAVTGKPLYEATIELCEKAGIPVPYKERRPRQPRARRTEKRSP
jgi:hypothetical protein